jgi:hypothetical protein
VSARVCCPYARVRTSAGSIIPNSWPKYKSLRTRRNASGLSESAERLPLFGRAALNGVVYPTAAAETARMSLVDSTPASAPHSSRGVREGRHLFPDHAQIEPSTNLVVGLTESEQFPEAGMAIASEALEPSHACPPSARAYSVWVERLSSEYSCWAQGYSPSLDDAVAVGDHFPRPLTVNNFMTICHSGCTLEWKAAWRHVSSKSTPTGQSRTSLPIS